MSLKDFSRVSEFFSPSPTFSTVSDNELVLAEDAVTSVCVRQTLGIVVIIDLLHSAHTVMGKCQNWTDQRRPGSTVGTLEGSAAAAKREVGWGTTQPVFSLAPSDGSPCLRRLPPCQSFLFTTSTHWDSESCPSANWL